MLKVGAGKSEILLIDELLPLEQFTQQRDSLFVRAVIIEETEASIFISLDVTSLQEYAIEAMKNKIKEHYAIAASNIFITVTHTFSAPHTRSLTALETADTEVQKKNQQYLALLLEAVIRAFETAKQTLQQVRMSSQTIQVDCNVNRDVELPEGYWLGQNRNGFSDKMVPAVKFTTKTGQVVAIIYSVNVQSTIIETADKSTISSDLIGVTSKKIEEQCGCVALFMLGAAADQAPNVPTFNYQSLEMLASKVAQQITSQLKNAEERAVKQSHLDRLTVTVGGQQILKMNQLKPTKNYSFVPSTDKEVTVSIFTLGELAIVMLKPELNSITGYQIRDQSPYAVTIVATMVNGGQKYMADEQSYQRFTYEAMNSMFAQGSAEIVSQNVIAKLKELKERK